MTFQGNLESLCIYDVFQNVQQNQLTGTLTLTTEKIGRWIHFEKGKIHMLSLGESVGLPMKGFLVRRGYVRSDKLSKALKSRGRSRILLRDLLEREKVLSLDQYMEAFEQRTREFIYDVLRIKEAQYEFHEGPAPKGYFDMAQKGMNLALVISPLLVEAARRDDEWQRIRKVVSSDRDLFIALGEEAPQGSEAVSLIWDALDGRTELCKLESIVGMGHFEICETLCEIVAAGAARPVKPAELHAFIEESLAADAKDEARILCEHALEIERHDMELRKIYAQVLEELGENKKAGEAWALLAYQESIEQNDEEALRYYRHASALNPDDIGLLEGCFEILSRIGDSAEFGGAAVELGQRFMSLGLMDRAIEILEKARKRPEIALRPEILEILSEAQRESGRSDDALRQLVDAADQAEKSGNRERAMEVLQIGQRIFPDSKELAGRLSDLASFKREKRSKLRRRFMRIGLIATTACLLCLVLFDEFSLVNELRPLLREIPIANADAGTGDLLGQVLAREKAHPLALSTFLVKDLAQGLVAAELTWIKRQASVQNFDLAERRLRYLDALIIDEIKRADVRMLHIEVASKRAVYAMLEPQFLRAGGETGREQGKALVFAKEQVSEVLYYFHWLTEKGKGLVLQEVAKKKLGTTVLFFTELYFKNSRDPAEPAERFLVDGKQLSLTDLIQELWLVGKKQGDAETKVAMRAAYKLLADAYFSKDESLRERAKVILPYFLKVPRIPVENRAEFRRLMRL